MTYDQYLAYADRLTYNGQPVQPYSRKQWDSLSDVHKFMIARDCARLGISTN